MEDRLAIYAAMAEDDLDDDGVTPISVVLPSPTESDARIARLEKIVDEQRREIERLRRDVKQLSQSQKQTKTILNNQIGRMSDLSRDLDNKIDRRD